MEKEEYEKLLAEKEAACQKRIDQMKAEVDAKEKKMMEIINSTYPMNVLASCRADAVARVFDRSVKQLQTNHPHAQKAIEEVKNMRALVRRNAKTYELMRYKYELILNTLPEAKDILEEDGNLVKGYYDSQKEDDSDHVANWLSKSDYEKLSESERNQKALDRYKASFRKSNWQIGRDYELYCCYWLSTEKGLSFVHNGILKMDDLGRDIIASAGMQDYVVQCKYWSKSKKVHENVVMQLYASTVEYTRTKSMEQNQALMAKPIPVLITNIDLSETAKRIAEVLHVKYIKLQIGEYPMIKCNVGKDGSKIYHLPFDQQYDKVKILNFKKDMAWTVKEAEEKGFRRAKRYRFGRSK